MTTVKLEDELVKELRVMKAELSAKSYSALIAEFVKYYKESNKAKYNV